MVIGLAVGITVAVVAALFFFCHRKQRRQGKSADGPGGSGGIGIPSMNRDQAWNMDFAFSNQEFESFISFPLYQIEM